MKFHVVSWEKLQEELFLLSKKIVSANEHFDLIVAIARGGLSSAQILSDFLKIPVASFTVTSYRDLNQISEPEITFRLGDKLHNKKILLVDDVSDTGKTFVRGKEYLHELGAEMVKTAAVFTKPKTIHVPDYFVEEVDKWIVFPYEIRETIESLKDKEKLVELGFTERYLEEYLKEKN